ncbi:MAG: hypothetical protein ACK587_10625 [Cyanobacteriota bacterium]
MTFDARSKERLEALGRTLPKKLPLPEPPAAPLSTAPPASKPGAGERSSAAAAQRREIPERLPPGARRPPAETPRHPLERAQDPADLFRALISASADGTVPPHLLDRLRELEAPRRLDATQAPMRGQAPEQVTRAPGQGRKGASVASGGQRGSRGSGQARDDQDLYTAFAQLLLEDDEA